MWKSECKFYILFNAAKKRKNCKFVKLGSLNLLHKFKKKNVHRTVIYKIHQQNNFIAGTKIEKFLNLRGMKI